VPAASAGVTAATAAGTSPNAANVLLRGKGRTQAWPGGSPTRGANARIPDEPFESTVAAASCAFGSCPKILLQKKEGLVAVVPPRFGRRLLGEGRASSSKLWRFLLSKGGADRIASSSARTVAHTSTRSSARKCPPWCRKIQSLRIHPVLLPYGRCTTTLQVPQLDRRDSRGGAPRRLDVERGSGTRTTATSRSGSSPRSWLSGRRCARLGESF